MITYAEACELRELGFPQRQAGFAYVHISREEPMAEYSCDGWDDYNDESQRYLCAQLTEKIKRLECGR